MFNLEYKKDALGVYIDYLKVEIEKILGNKPKEVVLKGGRYMGKGDVGDRGAASTQQDVKCILRDTTINSLDALNEALSGALRAQENMIPKDFVSLWSLVTVSYAVGEVDYEKSFLIVPIEGGHDLGEGIFSISAETPLALSLIGNGDNEVGEEVETIIQKRTVYGEIIDLV